MQYLKKNILSVVFLLVGILTVFFWEQKIPDQTKLKQVSGKVISISNSGKRTVIGLSGIEGLFTLNVHFGHGCQANETRGTIGSLLGQNVAIEYLSEINRRYFTKINSDNVYSLVSTAGYACTYQDIDSERRRSNSNSQVFGYIVIILGLSSLLKKPKAAF